MKQEEGKKKENKKRRIVKRQVSIITVFLWIFLVTTMITIVAQNVKNVNTLDEENINIYEENKMDSRAYGYENFNGTFIVSGTPEEAIANKLKDSYGICEYQGQWFFTVPNAEYYFVLNEGWTLDYISVTGHTSIDGASDKDYAEYGSEVVFDDTSNVSIIYHFKKIEPTFKLEYDTNCEENVPVIIFSQDIITNDDSYTFVIPEIPEIVNYRPGYEFLGWSRDPDGEPEYKANSSITINKNNTNIRLYAIWIEEERIKIPVEKVWLDNDNEYGKRPNTVTLQVKNGENVVASHIVSEEDEWKHIFELPKYDERGDEIEYTVDEDYVSEFYIKNIVGNVITNTFVVPEDRVKVTGTKVWDDNGNAGGKRDDTVILQLKNEKDEVISEAEVSDKNNWSYEFEVAKYDGLVNIVKYHIDERDTENKFYVKELTDDNTVTNKFIVPDEKVLVKAVKVWDDKNNSGGKRPNSVTLQIYNKDILVTEKKVSDTDNWSFEVELPKYDELGEEITYTIDEKETTKYYEKEVVGNVVTNRLMYDLPNTSDINILLYIVIFVVAIVVVIVTVIFIHNNKK